MPDAILPARTERIGAGHFHFTNTNVKFADRGIEGLKYTVPVPQAQWIGENVSGSTSITYTYDAGTSRLFPRLLCGVAGTFKMRLRTRLPADFGAFYADCVRVVTQRNAAITSLKLTLEKDGVVDSTINGIDISPSGLDTWEAKLLTPGGSYFADDWVTLTVEFVPDTAGDRVDVADLSLKYVSAQGNI